MPSNSRNINSVTFWIKETLQNSSTYHEIEETYYGWFILHVHDLEKTIYYVVKNTGKVYILPAHLYTQKLKKITTDQEFIQWQIDNHILDVVDVIPPF